MYNFTQYQYLSIKLLLLANMATYIHICISKPKDTKLDMKLTLSFG